MTDTACFPVTELVNIALRRRGAPGQRAPRHDRHRPLKPGRLSVEPPSPVLRSRQPAGSKPQATTHPHFTLQGWEPKLAGHHPLSLVSRDSTIQVLDRTQPMLPIEFDATEKRTHYYTRHGTTNLFAATGEVTRPGSASALPGELP